MPNKRKEGDDTPEAPLLRRSTRDRRNTPVSYSESHRNQPNPSVATATTPLVHSADQPPTSSPVVDQQQLTTIQESHEPSARPRHNTPVSYSESHRNQPNPSVATATTPLVHNADQPSTPSPVVDHQQSKTIQESHEPNAVPPANVGELETSMADYEKEGGPVISESGKESVVDPNNSSVTQLNMGFATLFLHATITPITDTSTGKERLWVMFSDIRTNARDINFDRIMSGTVDRTVITRHPMSLIFYEEATDRGMVLTDMIDGTKVVPDFLAGPITLERVGHMKQVREKVFEVLNTQQWVTEEAWCSDRDYVQMLSNVKAVMDKKEPEGTPMRRELVYWNSFILAAFGSLNENRPQELLLLVLLHVHNESGGYAPLPDYFEKLPRHLKLAEVWSILFRIYTGLDDGQHRMLTWLRLACSFDDDRFWGDATLLGWTNPPSTGKSLRMNLPALKTWSRDDGNVSFITNELNLFGSNKLYRAAVANVRTLDQISGELHTGIDYKDKTKNILKSLIMAISADPTWWVAKSEKIKRYCICKIGNELSRSTNNEQAERIVINSDEFHRRATIAQYAHHGINMIPFTKVDRSKKTGLPNLDVEKNLGRERTALDFTMCPTKSSSSRSSLDLRFKGSIDNISKLPPMSLYCFLFVECVAHSLEDAKYFLNWLMKLRREPKWIEKEKSNPSEVKWELHNTNMMMLAIGSLNQHILSFCMDHIQVTLYKHERSRRKAGVQHKRIKFPVLKWATYLVMQTVRLHTLYPPFGFDDNKNIKKRNEGERKGVLSSMIDAHLEKFRHGENADAKSEFEAMIITPLFDAWQHGRCPMSLTQFEADNEHFDGNALSNYLLKFDRLHMGDGVCASIVDYGGDTFAVLQYEKSTQKQEQYEKRTQKQQPGLMKSGKRRPRSQTKEKQQGGTIAVKRRASPPRKAKEKKPKTTTDSSDFDSYSVYCDEEKDEEGDVKMSAKITGIEGTLDWNKGGQIVFGKQVARIIAVADNHYPGFMHNVQELENGFKLAISLSRTAKSTFHGVKDNNYMIVDPGLLTATIGEDEVATESPLGTQADVADIEQDHKLLGPNVGRSDHGDVGSETIILPCLDQEEGVEDVGEP
jgi:hypothetical protein